MVRNVLELTVRQNLHLFYQCRYYLLLFTELGMDTSNCNQFDNLLSYVDFIHKLSSCKPFSYSFAIQSVLSNRLSLKRLAWRVAGSITAGDIFFLLNVRFLNLSQLGDAHSNEIKHGHSALIYIILNT